MENKPAQNIQDTFLNTARKERNTITIYLLSGVKLTGRIRSFDKYSVVLETNNQEQLIFKHAISTVAMGRTLHGSCGEADRAARPGRDSDCDSGGGLPCRCPPVPRDEQLPQHLAISTWQLAISIWRKPGPERKCQSLIAKCCSWDPDH